MNLTKYSLAILFAVSLSTAVKAQDDLINKLKDNKTLTSKEAFGFKTVVNAEATSIKNQGSSSTCWSYSGNSYIESEMIRMGKKPIDIAEMFTVRNMYIDKAESYVRMHGGMSYGQGGAPHDPIDLMMKYGALPQELYIGLLPGQVKNDHSELESVIKGIIEPIAKSEKPISTVWKKALTGVVDTYLGTVPEKFKFEGKEYTPMTFAKDVVGIDAKDYVEITSYMSSPYYSQMIVMVPDNWTFKPSYNVQLNDMIETIDYALNKGYTVVWGTDVSEKSFSWKNGVAYVPTKSFADMSDEDKKDMFAKPQPEIEITPELRQKAFDNYETTDDHGMQITGIAKDVNGKEYYMVKNSWGTKNDYEGYLYVTKNFLKYKTTSILLHKDGVPKGLINKLGIRN
jgi:bleomycin hydrolase